MSFAAWLALLTNAEKTSIISGDFRKIHYKMPGGGEMAEEYSMTTGVISRRAWRPPTALTKGPTVDWKLELGDVVRPLNPSGDTFVLKESLTEPILSKRLTKRSIEWRIRNLPYPIETYSVTPADPSSSSPYDIVVRTTNKKFYKVIHIEELERCQTVPDASLLTVQHQHNTLIITYKKPPILLEMERQVLLMLQDVITERDLDQDCDALMQRLMGTAKNGEGDS